MKQDEIIEMAEKSGVAFASDEYPEIWQTFMHVGKEELENFAELVHQRGYIDGWSDSDEAKKTVSFEMIANAVEAEREACAKVCDDINAVYSKPEDAGERVASQWCAERIRARGEA